MSYRYDPYDKSIVIDGFEKGIADSPYDGISDMRNVNIISVPGEGSVNFATISITPPVGVGNVISANSGADTVLLDGDAGSLEQSQAIVFAGGSLPGGIVAGTFYWVFPTGGGNFQLYTDYGLTSILNITSSGTGTWATVNMGQPKYFDHFKSPFSSSYFMVDSLGQVWSNMITPTSKWRFTGNTTNFTSHGNGLVSYIPSNSGTTALGYLFVFRDYSIDYATITSNTTLTWTYGWNPATGTSGNTNYLKSYNTASSIYVHEAFVAPDSRVYYCDANWIGRWYQTDPSVGFDPATTSTYTFDQTALLPTTDIAQCLTFLGTSILVGGINNVIYPWDRFSSNFSYPILIPEYNIKKMVTVNTNTFIFVGNRGRIYITNGTNAQLYKKVPDHISGTVEPYYSWGGATSVKNQLYFSMLVTTNAGVAINQYGGVWAIDLDTEAIRLVNKLSYETYAGFASAIIPNFSDAPAGTGLYVGWDKGSSGYGLDTTIAFPYSGSQATIDSDLIPIGTFNKPKDMTQIEYKLSRPLVSGETITIKTRLIFNTSDTGYTTTLTDNVAGNFSNTSPINFQQAQWAQFQIVLQSILSTSPSYVRLKQIRILGVTGN